jgi:predicted acetyltransferase
MPVVPYESELYPWLSGHYMSEIKAANIWMARIINVKLTLDDLPVVSDGEITVKISDDHCPQNNQTYKITSQKGKLSVQELGEKSSKLEMTQEGLAALVYGLLRSDDLESFNWIKNATEEEKVLLDVWFPKLPPILTEGF